MLLAQALIVSVTSLMSWMGHKHYSFRRSSSLEESPEESPEELHR